MLLVYEPTARLKKDTKQKHCFQKILVKNQQNVFHFCHIPEVLCVYMSFSKKATYPCMLLLDPFKKHVYDFKDQIEYVLSTTHIIYDNF